MSKKEKKNRVDSESTPIPKKESKQKTGSADQEEDYQKLNDDYLRLAAEFDNYKKRISKDQENIVISAVSMFALSLLPLVDSFDNALEQNDNNNIKTLYEQLIKSLEAIEIVEVPGVGNPFNPKFHEAMEHDGEGEEQKVSEVLRKGFMFRDRLIRPALVKVSSE